VCEAVEQGSRELREKDEGLVGMERLDVELRDALGWPMARCPTPFGIRGGSGFRSALLPPHPLGALAPGEEFGQRSAIEILRQGERLRP